jgi:nicotinamidase-related amidase
MTQVRRLARGHTALAIIDMQEAFRSVIADFGDVASRIATVVQGAKLLNIPILLTEQYPKGLKHTADEIIAVIPQDLAAIEKSCFSSCGEEQFPAGLISKNIKQVLVCGIEAHICVMQTSLDLIERGFEVYLLVDCITSRRPENKQAAVKRLVQAGAIEATVEMALFEIMRTAESTQFKAIQQLVK